MWIYHRAYCLFLTTLQFSWTRRYISIIYRKVLANPFPPFSGLGVLSLHSRSGNACLIFTIQVPVKVKPEDLNSLKFILSRQEQYLNKLQHFAHFKGLKTGASLWLKQRRRRSLSGSGEQYQQKTSKELQQRLYKNIHLQKFAPVWLCRVSPPRTQLQSCGNKRLYVWSQDKAGGVSDCAPSYHPLPPHRLVPSRIEKGCEEREKKLLSSIRTDSCISFLIRRDGAMLSCRKAERGSSLPPTALCSPPTVSPPSFLLKSDSAR